MLGAGDWAWVICARNKNAKVRWQKSSAERTKVVFLRRIRFYLTTLYTAGSAAIANTGRGTNHETALADFGEIGIVVAAYQPASGRIKHSICTTVSSLFFPVEYSLLSGSTKEK